MTAPASHKKPWPDWTPPALAAWFHAQFAAPTATQQLAWRRTFHGGNVLILAPTGSGKTLSAFFALLAQLGARAERGKLPNTVLAVYVSPLRALGRDIFRNLEGPLSAINAALPPGNQIRMEIRTGDTDPGDRARMSRRRPHLLLTTPESLSSLLSQQPWRDGFAPETVVVDEIHSFAENKRGSLLALTLERLQARAPHTLQRIGLSATAQPADAVAQLLCGRRPCAIVSDSIRRLHRLEVQVPAHLPAAGYDPGRIAHAVVQAVTQAQTTLAFTATRSSAERLGLALSLLIPDGDKNVAVHHASIEREIREEVERRLAAGEMRAVVCSTSLEMGVDYANVDQVLLIGTPRGVSRALQRLGRSGHRAGGVAFGRIVPLSLPDLLEALAMRQAVMAGYIEDLAIPLAPLDVLAQCLLGMAVERPHTVQEAWALTRAAGPYLHLSRADFDAALDYLAGGGRVLARFGKILIEDGVFRVASPRLAREYFQGIGTISEDFRVRIVTKNHRRLGEVEEGFLSTLRPGEAFSMGGRAVELETLHGATAVVKPSNSDRVTTPRWMGGKMPLSTRMAEEELRLRRHLRTTWSEGGRPAVEAMLREIYQATIQQSELAGEFVARQYQAAPIPIDSPVQIELVGRGKKRLLMVHCVAGRAVNQSLAWVAAHRLAQGESVISNSDDHGHLLVLNHKIDVSEPALRLAYHPGNFVADLEAVLRTTETLGRRFRAVAETGQLVKRRGTGKRYQAWNGSLLYQTLLTYEPDHLLVKETVREVLGDLLDAPNAQRHAADIFESPWEVFEHPRPSPFALPLFAAFNREVLLAQDPGKAFDEFAASVYEEWNE
ncbi:MAG TPA: DEAD/DEAH box helicase [Bryobacteraceae bacterium]|nr:DEAD/DEAH box helicase [Bryobacteraceae bacterium]